MKNSKFTIFFIPDDSPKRYQFTITKKMVLMTLTAFCIIVVAFLVITTHYIFLQNMALENIELQKENRQLSHSLKELSQETKKLTESLNKVEVFKNKIKLLANINDTERNLSIGPVEPINKENNFTRVNLFEDIPFLNSSTRMTKLSILKRRVELLASEFEAAERELAEAYNFFEESKEILRSTPAKLPCYGWITSTFGYRNDPFTGERTFHKGLDIATSIGVPVVASADGTVVSTGFNSGMGNVVVIDHGLGIVTSYGHLNDIKVKPGDRVERGEIIGTVGNTGRSTGPHLHYEVIVNGINVNPMKYIIE